MNTIEHALDQLRHHGGLSRVGAPKTVSDDTVSIEVDIPVELPSRAKRAGASTTGVLAIETCTLMFKAWPIHAPRPFLRADFPRNLPHINPGAAHTPVSPCIFEGSLDELLHRLGLDAVIDQLIDWLTKAAAGNLINLQQGWEPTRRDSCPSVVVASALNLITAAPKTAEILQSQATYYCIGEGIYAHLNTEVAATPNMVFSQQIVKLGSQDYVAGECAVFILRAPIKEDGSHIVATYQPESVVDLPSLYERATLAGADSEGLRHALERHYSQSIFQFAQDARAWANGLYAIVILLTERPINLIGAPGRAVEMLPYVVHFKLNPKRLLEHAATAHPAFHSHALTPELMASAAGTPVSAISKKVVLLGCGSLGSKLGMHLGRAGFGDLIFIDNDSMSTHNLARHALAEYQSNSGRNKAELMREAFAGLSHGAAKAFTDDAAFLLASDGRFAEIVPADVELVIDSTASLKVLCAATQSNALNSHKGRLVRAQLYASGQCAVLMLEGQGRSVRVDDLNALFFELSRHERGLREIITSGHSDLSRLFVGDNCRSLTMQMSDATISRAAAAMGMRLERWLSSGVAPEGELCIGTEDPSGLGMNWSCLPIQQTTVIAPKTADGWEVRVLEHVKTAIDQNARQWGRLETGGALIGRVSDETRAITVTGLVAAPPDSKRKPTTFVLGVEGLSQELKRAHHDSAGHLMFVGTWHSHPMGGGHSGLDRDTLAKIANLGKGLPMLSLVWTPNGLICEVEQV